MIIQYVLNMTEVYEQNNLRTFMNIISEERGKKINYYRLHKDKYRCLFAEILIRYCLYQQFNLNTNDIVFNYNKFGKPSLAFHKEIFFNVSHAGEWIVCSVGNVPLGIDVEYIKEDNLKLAKQFYTAQEYSYIINQPTYEQSYCFYKLWTLKESYIKNLGIGLNLKLNSFYFEIQDNSIQLYTNGNINNNYQFTQTNIDKHHFMSLCVRSKNSRIIDTNIQTVCFHNLLEFSKLEAIQPDLK